MSKFKKGDLVYYIEKDTGQRSTTFEVIHTNGDEVWFTTDTWMPEDRLMLERPDAAYKPAAAGLDAHTAGNLRTNAMVAIETYNNYIRQRAAPALWRELELR
jgi:hypothetical protein